MERAWTMADNESGWKEECARLEKLILAHDKDYKTLVSRVDELERLRKNDAGHIQDLINKLAGLTGRVKDQEDDGARQNLDLGGKQAQIDALKVRVSDLNGRLAILEASHAPSGPEPGGGGDRS